MAYTGPTGAHAGPMASDPVEQDWLRLDNAAKIYPSSFSVRSPAVFRMSVRLRAPVRVSALQQALRRVLLRCPYFQVYLKRGFFWYYLQRHDAIPAIEPMDEMPLSVIPIHDRDTHLLRVQARERTIAIDFSHVLTDGSGGLKFLGTLATEYLRLCGVAVPDPAPFLDPAQAPDPEEFEDAHNRFFQGRLPKPPRLAPAYQLAGGAPAAHGYRVITARMPVAPVLALARGHEASLTEYLVALYAHSLAQVRRTERACARSVVRIEVPVNMRQFYPSATMRNFSLYVSPEIDLAVGDYSLEEIAARVHHSMRMEVDAKQLSRQIARNVGAERNPLVRVAPLALKDLMLSVAHRRLAEGVYSGVLSNLGRVAVPQAVEPHVESFDWTLGPNPAIKKNCAVLTFRDELRIAFGSVVEDRALERRFVGALVGKGIAVTVGER